MIDPGNGVGTHWGLKALSRNKHLLCCNTEWLLPRSGVSHCFIGNKMVDLRVSRIIGKVFLWLLLTRFKTQCRIIVTAVYRNKWIVLTEMISNGPHNTNQPHESAKLWMAESRKTFPRQNCRHYWLLQMTNKIKYLFALTDKGIEFVFTSFLYINLVIMFLFVLEVRLHSFGQIHFQCSFPFLLTRLILNAFWTHSERILQRPGLHLRIWLIIAVLDTT